MVITLTPLCLSYSSWKTNSTLVKSQSSPPCLPLHSWTWLEKNNNADCSHCKFVITNLKYILHVARQSYTTFPQPIHSLMSQFSIFSSLLRSSMLLPHPQSQMVTLLSTLLRKKKSDKIFHKLSWPHLTTYLHWGPMCSAFTHYHGWAAQDPSRGQPSHLYPDPAPLTDSGSLQQLSSFSCINNFFSCTGLFPLSYKLNILS